MKKCLLSLHQFLKDKININLRNHCLNVQGFYQVYEVSNSTPFSTLNFLKKKTEKRNVHAQKKKVVEMRYDEQSYLFSLKLLTNWVKKK